MPTMTPTLIPGLAGPTCCCRDPLQRNTPNAELRRSRPVTLGRNARGSRGRSLKGSSGEVLHPASVAAHPPPAAAAATAAAVASGGWGNDEASYHPSLVVDDAFHEPS